MLETQHGQRTIEDFINLAGNRRLNLTPAFQRKSVWSTRDRRLLIQSIFEGMPIPSIYLYAQVGARGANLYDVIDGKQRLETILWFAGKGPLAGFEPLAVKTNFDDSAPLEWWEWSDLSVARKNAFLRTKIPTIEVEGELGEIVDLFVRINSTGRRLQGQEKRHASYYESNVLKAAQRLADRYRADLLKWRVLSAGQVQRMKDVELMTELLLGINAGVHLNKKAKLDEIIKGKGIEDADLRVASQRLSRSLNLVRAVLPDIKSTRFSQLADFYSLVLLLDAYREEGKNLTVHAGGRNALAGNLLRDFGHGVEQVREAAHSARGASAEQEPFRQYLMTVKEGTDSAKQRRAREKLLREVLDGVFDDLATKRAFNATQRRILWHASGDKSCAICYEPVSWEDLAIDHVEPYIHGGATALENGALTHRKCNARVGAK